MPGTHIRTQPEFRYPDDREAIWSQWVQHGSALRFNGVCWPPGAILPPTRLIPHQPRTREGQGTVYSAIRFIAQPMAGEPRESFWSRLETWVTDPRYTRYSPEGLVALSPLGGTTPPIDTGALVKAGHFAPPYQRENREQIWSEWIRTTSIGEATIWGYM